MKVFRIMGSKLIIGTNDLLSQRPDLAAEWHPTKNGDLIPQNVSVHSARPVWWQIEEVRYGKVFLLEWEATISNRANGSGCPYISKPPKKLLKGFNDLLTTNPELAEKWHPSKNGEITPDMVFENTDKKYWWYHEAERWGKRFIHEWQASPKDVKRGGKEGGCPICHGTQVLHGYNDVYTCAPEIVEEWDYEKNEALGLDPKRLAAGSNVYAYWICKYCGHTWRAMIQNRVARKTRCPQCAQRSQTSFSEQAIYFYIKRRFPNCVNRDKKVLDNGELDVYLPDIKVAIEYCGLFAHSSDEKKIADEEKRKLCMNKGIRLIQVFEHDSKNQFLENDDVIYCVPKQDYSHLNYVMACISGEMISLGLIEDPIQIDIKKDECTIREQYQQSVMGNSIAISHPSLLSEWDYQENGLLKPHGFSAGSRASVGWVHTCYKDDKPFIHKWKARICTRAREKGTGCPICAGKKVQEGYNDLLSCNPPFLHEWDCDRNEISPNEITPYSKQKVWWRHQYENKGRLIEHPWQASPGERMNGNGCAICAGKVIIKGINDLTATHNELLREWDYGHNIIKPDTISYGYDKKVWWKHTVEREGTIFTHSWEASPNSRTNRKSGCPYCENKKVLRGFNDLETLLPEIAERWDYERNVPLKPCDVTVGSGKKVFWIDRDCPISICDRTKYKR